MFTGNKKCKKIVIIISLISYNNKDFLTLTSIYIQHLLRLKSLKKIINNKHDTESLFKVPLLVPELSKHVHNTFFSAALPNKRSWLLEKTIEIFLSLLIPQKRWNILFSSENDRFFQLAHHRAKSCAIHPPSLSYTDYQSPH